MNKPTVSTVLWLVFSWMLSVPAIAGEVKPPNPIAEVKVSPTRVDWVPAVDAERWVLTLAGPGDFLLRRQFEAGQAPFLSLYGSEGESLPDGSYAWELQGMPEQEAGTGAQELPDPSREKGRIFKALREPQMLLSGRLAITDGSFVAVPQGGGANAPQPPLHNIIAKDSLLTGRFTNDGNACIGDECNSLSDANFSAFKIKSTLPHLLFDDVELPCEGCPTGSPHDWGVLINQSDVNQFSISDFVDDVLTSTPFTLRGGAPDNSLFVASNGRVGLGTANPNATLHLFGGVSSDAFVGMGPNPQFGSGPAFNVGYGGFSFGRGAGFVNVRPDAAATPPNPSLRFLTANVERMIITNTGDVGIGTSAPESQLHVRGNDAGFRNRILIENVGAFNFREMLELRNNGGPVFILEDTSVPQRWAQGTGGANFLIDEQAHAGTEFTLTNTGNLTIAGTLTQGSSRDLKTDFTSLAPQDVLARVASLSVSVWSYKTEAGVRHAGPVAEDFHHVFGLGADDKHIAPGDQAGIALLAVQGLNQVVQEKDKEIVALRDENRTLAERVSALEAAVSALVNGASTGAEEGAPER